MSGELSATTAKVVAQEVKKYRALLGTDTAIAINLSVLAELSDAYDSLKRQLEAERARAEKAERREDQFRNWWVGVKQQYDNHMRGHHTED